MENENGDKVKIKEEVNDRDEMEADSFTIKEEMTLINAAVKQEEEDEEDSEAGSIKTTSGSSKNVPGATAGEVAFKEEMGSNNINTSKRRPTRTIKALQRYSHTSYKPGPASRRKRKKSQMDDSECEPSTTSLKKQTSAVSGSSNKSDNFEKATSSKQVPDVDNDVESDNEDDQDDVDDEDDEIDDEEEVEENSSYRSFDDSAGERYRPRTRPIPPYKDTNSTHSDERICHRKYSRETLRAALEAVKTHKLSMRKASKEFGVPYSTISRLKTEDNPFKRRGRSTLLTEEEEEDLIRWIKERSEIGYRVTPSILRNHVQSLMNEKPGGSPTKNTPPSRKWFTNFLSRHPEIAIRKPVSISPGRKFPQQLLPTQEDYQGERLSFGVETFRSSVGDELIEQLENERDVGNRSKEFQALHRLWKMFSEQLPGKNSVVGEVLEQTLDPFT